MTDFLGKIFGVCFRFIYDLISGLGGEPSGVSFYAITIIVTTILFKLLLLPLGFKQSREMKKMAKVQPRINEIQQKYKSDPQTMNAKMMQLMKEEHYNPMGGCLPMLIQFPIFLAFFKIMRQPEVFVFADGIFPNLQANFFWIQNLRDVDPWVLPVVSGLATFLSSYVMQKGQVNMQSGEAAKQAESMQKGMMYFFPVMMFMMGRTISAGVSLYWVTSNLFQFVQQYIFNRGAREEAKEALEHAKEEKLAKINKNKEQ